MKRAWTIVAAVLATGGILATATFTGLTYKQTQDGRADRAAHQERIECLARASVAYSSGGTADEFEFGDDRGMWDEINFLEASAKKAADQADDCLR